MLAIFVHSLTYNAFFEDPYMWVFMALASAVVTRIVCAVPPGATPSTTSPDGDWTPGAAAKAAVRGRHVETRGAR